MSEMAEELGWPQAKVQRLFEMQVSPLDSAISGRSALKCLRRVQTPDAPAGSCINRSECYSVNVMTSTT